MPRLSKFKDLSGKRVLLRVDFNVPPPKQGHIAPEEEHRIRAVVPTLHYLAERGAKIIIISHLGRPEGREKRFSLAPVAKHLSGMIGVPVQFVADSLDAEGKVEKKLSRLHDGGIAMLENVRFSKGEDACDAFFARRLASLGDLFVNDAFGVCHRRAASIVLLPKLLPSAAGLLLEKEVDNLTRVLEKPKRPFVALIGGAKISTKLPTIERMLALADTVLVGGGIANSLFKAKGYEIGKSLFSGDDLPAAKKLLGRKNLVLPKDVLASTSRTASAKVRVVASDKLRASEHMIDVGTATIREYAALLKKARTIVWNGPMGLIEIPKFAHGSVILGRVIASRSSGTAFGVVGGGETVACLEATRMAEYVDHVSTGGGAMLEFLAGDDLPGIKALRDAKH